MDSSLSPEGKLVNTTHSSTKDISPTNPFADFKELANIIIRDTPFDPFANLMELLDIIINIIIIADTASCIVAGIANYCNFDSDY
jgi:hypothetical protein